jgi:hypothetical protein
MHRIIENSKNCSKEVVDGKGKENEKYFFFTNLSEPGLVVQSLII